MIAGRMRNAQDERIKACKGLKEKNENTQKRAKEIGKKSRPAVLRVLKEPLILTNKNPRLSAEKSTSTRGATLDWERKANPKSGPIRIVLTSRKSIKKRSFLTPR